MPQADYSERLWKVIALIKNTYILSVHYICFILWASAVDLPRSLIISQKTDGNSSVKVKMEVRELY